MCGIIGFVSKNNKKFNLEKIKTLSLCNSYERGGDASGFYTPEKGIFKNVLKAHDFLLGYTDDLDASELLIGHFRKSSIGVNNIRNAHPFEYNTIVGCHNGTLSNHAALALKYGIPNLDWYTDSHVLLNLMSQAHLGEIPLSVLDEYTGSAAVLYAEKETNRMFAYRDDLRPLYYGFSKEGIYISSLEYALEIIGCANIEEFEANKLTEMENGEITNITQIPKAPAEPVPDYPLAAVTDIVYKGYHLGGDSAHKLNYTFRSNRKFSGIKAEALLVWHVVGYSIQYTNVSIRWKNEESKLITSANLTKGAYYTVLDAEGIDRSVYILDDLGFKKKVPLAHFDCSNFIPLKDRYVRLRTTLTSQSTNEKVGDRGEMMLVKFYTYGDPNVTVLNPVNGLEWTIPVRYLNCIEKTVSDTYAKTIEERKKNQTVNSTKESDFEIEEEDDSPFIDGVETPNDSIESQILAALIIILSDKLKEIISKYAKGDDIEDLLLAYGMFLEKCQNHEQILKEIDK